MNPKSRAHRSLRDSKDFLFSNPDDVADSRLEAHENLICTYSQGQSAMRITDRALHVQTGGLWTRIPYHEIHGIKGPESKADDAIWLSFGETSDFELAITGTQGKFKDVFPFIHFLRRVMEDIEKGRFLPS